MSFQCLILLALGTMEGQVHPTPIRSPFTEPQAIAYLRMPDVGWDEVLELQSKGLLSVDLLRRFGHTGQDSEGTRLPKRLQVISLVALGTLKDPPTFEVLRDLTRNHDPVLRQGAWISLGKWAAPEAFAILRGHLESVHEDPAAYILIDELGRDPSLASRTALVNFAQADTRPRVKEKVRRILSQSPKQTRQGLAR